MQEPELRRKLVAILAADAAGYTRLMGQNEAATHRAYINHRAELFDLRISEFGGTIVKGTGDGFLAEFNSVVDAVRYAIAVQKEMRQRNQHVPMDQRLEFRMGINLGDVIIEDDDIYGDGVNVAARLEGLARPGGICISGTVYDQIKNKLSVAIFDQGFKRVKNVREPVRVYRITMEDDPDSWFGLVRRGIRPARKVSTFAMTVLGFIALVAASTWFLNRSTDTPIQGEQSSSAAATLVLPKKPSVAVLALKNLSGDGTLDYFSDGITDDIITDLSRIAGLFVISRHSSFAYKDSKLPAKTIGRNLGVKFLIEGGVTPPRRDDPSPKGAQLVRLNLRLIDAGTGAQVWATSFNEKFDNILSVRDRFTQKVVDQIQSQFGLNTTDRLFQRAKIAEISRQETTKIDAYDSFLQGWQHFLLRSPYHYARAIPLFEKAVVLDNSYTRAYAALAATYLDIRIQALHCHPQLRAFNLRSREQAELTADKFRKLAIKTAGNNPDPLELRVTARMRSLERRHQEALEKLQEAIATAPNDADNYARLSFTYSWLGQASKALEAIETAMRLNPHYPPVYLSSRGIAKFIQNRFEPAKQDFLNGFARNPENSLLLTHLIATYGHLGRSDLALEAKANLNKLRRERGRPIYSVQLAARRTLYAHRADTNRMLDGLRAAGVPEPMAEIRAIKCE